MKAAVLVKPGEILVETFAVPVPKRGEVRVKLRMTGICGSDVHFFNGDRLLAGPTIIGHEGLGEIDLVGEDVQRKTGERVVIEPNIPCNKCSFCLQGRGNICPNKRVIGVNEAGCFAEYICLPEQFCVSVPDTISDSDAVTIEPLAVAYHALFTARAQPGDAILITGLGAIGLLLAHLALALGYRVYVSELRAEKLNLAVTMGAARLPDLPLSELNSWLTQQNINAIFECSGSEKAASMVTAIAPRGSQIILVGLSEKMATFQPLKLAREGIDLIGSIIYDQSVDFRRVIRLIEAGIISPGQIISKTVALSEIHEGITLAAGGDHNKIIISIA